MSLEPLNHSIFEKIASNPFLDQIDQIDRLYQVSPPSSCDETEPLNAFVSENKPVPAPSLRIGWVLGWGFGGWGCVGVSGGFGVFLPFFCYLGLANGSD